MNRSHRALHRRSLLQMSALTSVALLAGCGIGDSDDGEEATSEPDLQATEEAVPTQAPIASPVPGFADPERWNGRTLTVAGWGGDFQAALEDAMLTPFSVDTGASIDLEVAEVSALRRQVENDEVTWDLIYLPMEETLLLGTSGYLAPIDYQVVDDSPLFADIVSRFAVGCAYYSSVLIHPFTDQAPPAGWRDFWAVPFATPDSDFAPVDVRSLRRGPVGTLEFALLADGVPIDDLYPLDVERAFASLDRIRDNVIVWWQESKEPVELIASGQAGMASGWNVRLEQLDLGGQLHVQWNQGMLSSDGWAVPSGAPNADVAMDFIHYATRAVPTANLSRLIPYGPVNPEAFPLLDERRLEFLPSAPANKDRQFIQNWGYWSFQREQLTEQFETWLLEPEELEGTPEG